MKSRWKSPVASPDGEVSTAALADAPKRLSLRIRSSQNSTPLQAIRPLPGCLRANRHLGGDLVGMPEVVGVEEGDVVPLGQTDGFVSSRRQSPMTSAFETDPRQKGRDRCRGAVGRTVVHEDDLQVRPGLPQRRGQRLRQIPGQRSTRR